jgi:hypothetical protein
LGSARVVRIKKSEIGAGVISSLYYDYVVEENYLESGSNLEIHKKNDFLISGLTRTVCVMNGFRPPPPARSRCR